VRRTSAHLPNALQMSSKPPVPAFAAPLSRPNPAPQTEAAPESAAAVGRTAAAAAHIVAPSGGNSESSREPRSEPSSEPISGYSSIINSRSHNEGSREGSASTSTSSAPAEVPPALLRYRPPDWAADVAPAEAAARTQAPAAAAFAAAAVAGEGGDEDDEGAGAGACGGGAAAPASWRLDVIKGGVPMGQVALGHRARWSLGRQGGGACDVVLEHPSISRAHAVKRAAAFVSGRLAPAVSFAVVQYSPLRTPLISLSPLVAFRPPDRSCSTT
jgi:hypothetical protein